MAVQAGLPVWSIEEMEAHALAGGDLRKVTRALIIANRARIPLTWEIAAVVDLAGRDILDAVQTSVNPNVIDCPISLDGNRGSACGDAKDGIQLQVQVRVTVRTNLLQLVGGATEATIVARVGQGIVAAIEKCQSFQTALATPMLIATEVQQRGPPVRSSERGSKGSPAATADHNHAGLNVYPRVLSAAVAGRGIPGGQVIDYSTADGTEIAGRPVKVNDVVA